jgi:Trk K+ transport system NAD-binding subunit
MWQVDICHFALPFAAYGGHSSRFPVAFLVGCTNGAIAMRIFLMGGTGLVGSRLIKHLIERKDEVVLLTRRPDAARSKWQDGCQIIEGNPMEAGNWQHAVGDCDVVVNLTGDVILYRRLCCYLLQIFEVM